MSAFENSCEVSVDQKDDKYVHAENSHVEENGKIESTLDNIQKEGCENPIEENVNSSADNNEYDYLKKNLFSSEIFKIEVRNLPKYYGIGELKKLFSKKLKLNVKKVKALSFKGQWMYVCFNSKEEQLRAIDIVNNYKWKGATLSAKIAVPAPDPFMKRKNEEQMEGSASKRIKFETSEDLFESIQNCVTPLWNVPYEDQLCNKTKHARDLLQKFGFDVLKANPDLTMFINKQKEENDGLPCKLYPCKGLNNNQNFYRNKCEFSIGINALTKEKTVGFRLGSYVSGSIDVAPVRGLKHVNDLMCQAVDKFETFVRESDLECYSPATLQGHWAQLTVRVGTATNELMLIAGLHSLNCTEAQIKDVKEKLKTFFTVGEGKSLGLTSLYLQMITRRENGTEFPKPELLLGNQYIQEKVCGVTFKISPNSFFQINTLCTELLIENIKDLAKVSKDTTVLDVCCGIGTLGLCLAKDCGQLLGLEKNECAVEDARLNATVNSVTNSEFFCGSADRILHSVVCNAKNDDLVAIVDPPRAGLHLKAVQLLRRTDKIKKIIFLSCDSNLAYKNFLNLCRSSSKSMVGLPFRLVSAIPIDLFPHTSRYELILYFEREDVVCT